jgi:hypothetical protein
LTSGGHVPAQPAQQRGKPGAASNGDYTHGA